jgi:hypothetical protein
VEQTVRKNLVATVVAFVIGFAGVPCFADGHAVNGYAASPAELQAVSAVGMRPTSPADHASATTSPEAPPGGRKCYYVLDVLLCD